MPWASSCGSAASSTCGGCASSRSSSGSSRPSATWSAKRSRSGARGVNAGVAAPDSMGGPRLALLLLAALLRGPLRPRRPPRRGGPRQVLVDRHHRPARLLEQGPPALARDLHLRLQDGPARRGDLLEAPVDALREDVVQYLRGPPLHRVHEPARGLVGRLPHGVVHLRHLLELPPEHLSVELLRLRRVLGVKLDVHDAAWLRLHDRFLPRSRGEPDANAGY